MLNSQISHQEPCISNATEGLQQSHLGRVHLLSLCQGIHGYKMRVILSAGRTSYCQLSQCTAVFLGAIPSSGIRQLQGNHKLLLRQTTAFVTFLLRLRSWKNWTLKAMGKNIKGQQKKKKRPTSFTKKIKNPNPKPLSIKIFKLIM